MQREVMFFPNKDRRIRFPYVREVLDYMNDGSGGYIEFDGYWHRMIPEYRDVILPDGRTSYERDDIDPLPCELTFSQKQVATQPYSSEEDPSGGTISYYTIRDYHRWRVLATAHTEMEDTSECWTDEEEGGKICLFPTARQRIDFQVLELLEHRQTDTRKVREYSLEISGSDTDDTSASVSVTSISL